MSARRWILTAISFLLAMGASAYIVRSSWSQEGARIGLPLWGHLACLTAATLEVLTRGLKIRLSAAALRISLSLRTAVRVSLGGDFGGSITPSRSGGEPARFLVLREAGTATADALVILFLELVLELLSLVALAAGLALVLGGSSGEVKGLIGMITGYSVFVLTAGAIGFVAARRSSPGAAPVWARRLGIGERRWAAIQRALHHLDQNIGKLRTARWWLMGAALASSIAHVLLRLSILPIVVYSLGVRAPLGPLVLWPLAIMYGGAAAPAPAGGGLIEVAFRGVLDGHIPVQVFGAALLWWRVYTFYILLVAGALVAGATVMRALRRNPETAGGGGVGGAAGSAVESAVGSAVE